MFRLGHDTDHKKEPGVVNRHHLDGQLSRADLKESELFRLDQRELSNPPVISATWHPLSPTFVYPYLDCELSSTFVYSYLG